MLPPSFPPSFGEGFLDFRICDFALLGRLGSLLGTSWEPLGTPSGTLGRALGRLKDSWGRPGGAPGNVLGRPEGLQSLLVLVCDSILGTWTWSPETIFIHISGSGLELPSKPQNYCIIKGP